MRLTPTLVPSVAHVLPVATAWVLWSSRGNDQLAHWKDSAAPASMMVQYATPASMIVQYSGVA